MLGLAVLAGAAIDTAGGGQYFRRLWRLCQRALQISLGVGQIRLRSGAVGGGGEDVQIVGMTLQQLLIQRQRLALVTGGGIQARQCGLRIAVVRLLRQHRRQRVVSAFQIAQLTQGIDLPQRVGAA